MTTTPSIPTPEDVDASWLTERLQAIGHDVAVAAFTSADIGTGQLGRCIRYELELEGGDRELDAAPKSLVGKFPSDDPASRQTGVMLRNYIREVRFYQEIQEQLDVQTPKCYYAEIEDEGPLFALLLSDLAPAQQGDQIAGCSETVAAAAVDQLTGLHAPTWNDESLRSLDWLGAGSPESLSENRERYRALLPGFLRRYGHSLERDAHDILTRYADSELWLEAEPSPFALIHIDYRLDNLLIDESGDSPSVSVVDWQSITTGRPLGDVAYFIGGGMLPEPRRRAEQQLVRSYHSRLLESGVDDYSFGECWDDYRRGCFTGFAVTVVASMLVQETERGNRMFTVMAQRHTRHALDIDAGALL